MANVQIVTPTEYREARVGLLAKEKAATKARDELAAERRKLPVVEVEKQYTFTTIDASGNEKTVTLADLFSGRRQLIIYSFMFGPNSDEPCDSCSLMGDSLPPLEHLNSRSTSLAVVSRAPAAKIAPFKKRMGWTFNWVSSNGSDFNYDLRVTMDEDKAPVEYNYRSKDELKQRGLHHFTAGEQPGISVFYRGGYGFGEEGRIYHTYSSFARGTEVINNTLSLLDLTPLGRQDGDTSIGGVGFRKRDSYNKEELQGLH